MSLLQAAKEQVEQQAQPASAKQLEEEPTLNLSLGEKILSFLHLKEKAGDLDVSITEEELQILRDRLPLIHDRNDLSFKLKYHFLGSKIIGKGASGVVRLATANGSEAKKFAVKELRRKRKQESCTEYLMKLINEFRIAIQMDHQNVVHTLDFVMIGDKWFEVMEYCVGGDLFAAIQRGSMTQDEIDCCFKQMVQGVRYLHDRGVSHRDLKPENMLIDAQGNIKITDFGVSETFYDNTPSVEPLKANERAIHKLKGLCGSCPYIAPEEFTSEEYDGRLVDVWSLGIIYYVMVFRGVPWEMAHPKNELFQQFLTSGFDGFEPFSRLSSRTRHILRRILEPNPAERATIEEICADDWFQRIRTCNNQNTESVSEKTFSYNCDSDHDDHPNPIHHHCLEKRKE